LRHGQTSIAPTGATRNLVCGAARIARVATASELRADFRRVRFTAHTGEDRSTGRAGMDGVGRRTQALQAFAILVPANACFNRDISKIAAL
jgi:hypothetical protein